MNMLLSVDQGDSRCFEMEQSPYKLTRSSIITLSFVTDAVAAHSTFEKFSSSTLIVVKDEPGQSMYIVRSGVLQAWSSSSSHPLAACLLSPTLTVEVF